MDAKEVKERMADGRIYMTTDEALVREQIQCLEKLYDYNATRPGEGGRRSALLAEMFAEIGENCYIEPPFHANFGGKHVHFGSNVYANFNLTLVDDGEIFVGSNVKFGPNVTVATAGHPIEPDFRRRASQYNIPVHIGDNVWVGAGSVILPGVHIGDNTVIGAGSVVTRDIPADVVAVGNPCRVMRAIGERDKEYYFRNRKIDVTLEEL